MVAGGVALVVPYTWADTDLGCETDLRPSVVHDATHGDQCLHMLPTPTFAPSVQLVNPADPVAAELRAAATVVRPGLDATRTEMRRADGVSRMGLVPADTGQVLLAESRDESEVHAIVASARRPPADVVAVPDALLVARDAAVSQVTAAGLAATVDRQPGPYAAGLVVVDPPVGTPVEPGSAVTLTVSTGPSTAIVSDRRMRRRGIALADPGAAVAAYPREDVLRDASDFGDGKAVPVVLRRATWTRTARVGITDRLVWVVYNADTIQTSLGGSIRDDPRPVAYFVGDLYSLVDARTGRGLIGGNI